MDILIWINKPFWRGFIKSHDPYVQEQFEPKKSLGSMVIPIKFVESIELLVSRIRRESSIAIGIKAIPGTKGNKGWKPSKRHVTVQIFLISSTEDFDLSKLYNTVDFVSRNQHHTLQVLSTRLTSVISSHFQPPEGDL